MTLDGFTPWPEGLARRYRDRGWWRGDRLGELPRRWADRSGDAEALVDGHRRWTYRALATDVDRMAIMMLGTGVAPDSHLLVQLPNIAEFVLLCFACYRIGVRPVLALPAHGRYELTHMVEVAGAKGFVTVRNGSVVLDHWMTSGSFEEPSVSDIALVDLDLQRSSTREIATLDALAPTPDQVALFLLSGGTTGLPKLIPRTHDDYTLNFRLSGDVCGFSPATKYLVVLPVAHNFPYGSPGLLGALEHGGSVVLCPSPNPAAALPLIEAERITHTGVVPAAAINWMERRAEIGADLASLEVLQVGGARLNPEAARRVRPELGCAVQQVFGMAEGLLNYTRLDEAEEWAIETQGRPMCPDDEIRIVDEAGNDLAADEPGELLTRGPYTLRGYFRAPEHNERSFTADGFYRSGDIVRRAAGSGNLVVEGRSKDFINRGGEKISAEEIENLVLAHPSVHNVAAIAVPDAVLGERVCAVLVLRSKVPAVDLDELRTFLQAFEIARFKLPERVELVDALPLTAVGKVDKKALRDRFGEAGSTHSNPCR
jgi:2,3-dihydroxybenzoate-AMP ligase